MAYQFESRVRYSETDQKKRLSIGAVVDYFQDCSTFQSEALGIGFEYLSKQNKVWMVLSWQIEILHMPVLGDQITIQTWPYEFKAFYGNRNFTLLDEAGNYLVKANSVWVLMDTETGRPSRPTEKQLAGYVMEAPLEMEYTSRKIAVEGEGERMEPFVVGRQHLDSNDHVNNGQYIHMAEAYLPKDCRIRSLKAEYRRQAHQRDVIVPMLYRQETGIMVALCDEKEHPYAIVQFLF